MVVPVMKAAASESRKLITEDTSASVPSRLSGTLLEGRDHGLDRAVVGVHPA